MIKIREPFGGPERRYKNVSRKQRLNVYQCEAMGGPIENLNPQLNGYRGFTLQVANLLPVKSPRSCRNELDCWPGEAFWKDDVGE